MSDSQRALLALDYSSPLICDDIRRLVEEGARVNIFSADLQTPLEMAKECDNEAAANLLSSLGGVNASLRRVHEFDLEISGLVAQLDAFLNEIIPGQSHGLSIAQLNALLAKQTLHFVAIFVDNVAVAMGGFEVHRAEKWAELKRFYCVPEQRGKGWAREILAHIFNVAYREYQLDCLRLETGTSQPEAIALYKSMGFKMRPIYGAYVGMPEFQIAQSVFLERPIGLSTDK